MTLKLFTEMNLDPLLMKALKTQGFETPTEIQSKVFPIIMSGQHLTATAETGTGKTLGYLLPIIEMLMKPSNKEGRGPRALILTPTRELADQVTMVIRMIAMYTRLKFGSITGGVPYFAQEQLLRKPSDILVATPGRLIDHMNQGRVDYSRLEFFILDEADRMLDMGFMKDIESILKSLPAERQILLFSATLEGPVQKIAQRFLKKPASVQLTTGTKPNALITQKIFFADDFNHKKALLLKILNEPEMWQAIVFTATKRGADEIADFLYAERVSSAALHGDMRQSKRSRTLERMREVKGKAVLRVLVATDVAARGIDVKTVTHVINFDMPRSAEDYIHRIGRTGRCGETGIAISLVGPKDRAQLSQIERFTNQRLERQVIDGLEPKMSEAKSAYASNGHSKRNAHSRSNSHSNSFDRRPSRGKQSSERSAPERRTNERRPHTGYSSTKPGAARNGMARRNSESRFTERALEGRPSASARRPAAPRRSIERPMSSERRSNERYSSEKRPTEKRAAERKTVFNKRPSVGKPAAPSKVRKKTHTYS